MYRRKYLWSLLTQSTYEPLSAHHLTQDFWRETPESCDKRIKEWRENPSWIHYFMFNDLEKIPVKSRHSYSIVRLQQAMRKIANVVLTSLQVKHAGSLGCLAS